MTVLELKELTKRYGTGGLEVIVVDHVSFYEIEFVKLIVRHLKYGIEYNIILINHLGRVQIKEKTQWTKRNVFIG